MNIPTKVYSLQSHEVVAEINLPELHKYILNKISVEFSEMSANCYYPKVASIYMDLLHMMHTDEKTLKKYSKEKYLKVFSYSGKFQLLHDPFTTILIIIVQEFLKNKDFAAAQAAFHLFSLRYYVNALHKMTTPKGSRKSICNSEAFQSALDSLSKNHMFVKQKTIPNSIMYYSSAIMKIYLNDLQTDNGMGLFKMIYALRTRIMQSMRSFAEKYYEEYEQGNISKEKEDGIQHIDHSHEVKLKNFISGIVTDICIYGKTDTNATLSASQLLKFNKKLSSEYVQKMAAPQFKDNIETALYLLLKEVKDIHYIKSTEFLDYVQKLMSIKVTKQEVYFKKSISLIHDGLIQSLGLQTWYNNLSIQSQAISRNFVAYYLVFYLRNIV
jgi:hypothetical protein